MTVVTTVEVLLEQQELAVRMIEGANGTKRPRGMSAADALASLDEEIQKCFMAAAEAAIRYFAERTQSAVELRRGGLN